MKTMTPAEQVALIREKVQRRGEFERKFRGLPAAEDPQNHAPCVQESTMATITIEIDIDADGNVNVSPNPAVAGDGDTVAWHVNSNAHGGGALVVKLPPSPDSPFGNPDEIRQQGVEMPRRCNLLEPSPQPLDWPEGSSSYSYEVEFSGSPINTVTGTLLKRRATAIEHPDPVPDVREIYLVPPNTPVGGPSGLGLFKKVYPLGWWKRKKLLRLLWKGCGCGHGWRRKSCCCYCCCCDTGGVAAPTPPAPLAPPTINLSQCWLPIGGQFYLLITPQGQRCQFCVEWNATGGVGQLTVDLELREAGSASFRTVASGLGPNDSYTHTGARTSYLFRATVTDSRGKSTFDTLSVTCP